MSNPADQEQQIIATIRDAEWRTGCACSPATLDWHRPFMPQWVRDLIDSDKGAKWVPFVASQVCDLVHYSLAEEPHVEFILGRLGVAEDPNIALKRSYRRLQLRHLTAPYAEFRVRDRWQVDRGAFAALSRAKELDLSWGDGIDLGRWIGGRYSRYPLPDELVKRMPLNKQRDNFKALTDEIDEFRILVSPPDQELKEGQSYNVVLYVIGRRATSLSEKAKKAYDKFTDWLRKLKGVTVQVHLVTDDQFTYAMLKDTYRLDLEAMTYGYTAGPKGGEPIDES